MFVMMPTLDPSTCQIIQEQCYIAKLINPSKRRKRGIRHGCFEEDLNLFICVFSVDGTMLIDSICVEQGLCYCYCCAIATASVCLRVVCISYCNDLWCYRLVL